MDVVIAGGHGADRASSGAAADRSGRQRPRPDPRPATTPPTWSARARRDRDLDLEAETDLLRLVEGADAIVFAAGAGPGSGPERKRTVDLGGAVKLMDAGVKRYVWSARSARAIPITRRRRRALLGGQWRPTTRLRDSALDYTIVRPGRLTDGAATGLGAPGRKWSARRCCATTSRRCWQRC